MPSNKSCFPILTLITLTWFTAPRAMSQPLATGAGLRHIPADADAVYHLDLGAIFSKTSIAMLETSFFGSGPGETKFSTIKATLQQGIDLRSDLYISVSNRYQPDSPTYTTIVFPLADAGKFITYLHSQIRALRAPDQPALLQHGQVFTSSDMAVAWDQHQAVVVIREPSQTSPRSFGIDVIRDINYRRALAAWRGFANSYFMTDPEFKRSFSEKADVHCWNRHGSGYAALNNILQLAPGGSHLAQMTRFLKATKEHTIGILRFDTGRISYRVRRSASRDEAIAVNRLIDAPFDSALVAGAPFGKVMAVATVHLDAAVFVDTLARLTGQPVQHDIPNALKGNCLLLAYAPEEDHLVRGSIEMPDIFATLTIRDSAAFTRLAGDHRLTDAGRAKEVDSVFHTPFHYYALRNDVAVITTTPQMANNYFNFSASASNPTGRLLTKRMQDGSFSIGIDMPLWGQWLIALLKGKEDAASARTRAVAAAYQKMGIFTYSTGHVTGNTIESDFELTLPDSARNSLPVSLDILKMLVAAGSRW